jgi:2-methylcitrate dehydratase
MTIYLDDGSTTEEVLIEYPSGHMSNPNTRALVEQKFDKNVGLKFDDAEIGHIKTVLNRDDAKIDEVLDLLTRKGIPGPSRL